MNAAESIRSLKDRLALIENSGQPLVLQHDEEIEAANKLVGIFDRGIAFMDANVPSAVAQKFAAGVESNIGVQTEARNGFVEMLANVFRNTYGVIDAVGRVLTFATDIVKELMTIPAQHLIRFASASVVSILSAEIVKTALVNIGIAFPPGAAATVALIVLIMILCWKPEIVNNGEKLQWVKAKR